MGRSGEGREGDGGGLGWGGVWAGHVFFTFVLGALPGVTIFPRFRTPLFHLFSTFSSRFFSRFAAPIWSRFFHVFFTFSLGKREKNVKQT